MPDVTSRTEPTAELKQSLRHEAAARRAVAHGARSATAGAALADSFRAAFAARLSGAVVSLYWPMRDEIDARALIGALAADGAQTALPVMAGPDAVLTFRAWRIGDVLVPGAFGVHEPVGDAPVLVPDIVVAPLLAFDAAGNRLGYGGGYYDRTLRDLRAGRDIVAVGVGYDEQEFRCVPGDTGDEILDMIVTDRRTLRVGE
ncbi:MAG: 5-formyltetrahydrofolate cyclo-ligase [Paracoccaceae bacterium]|jgi:5-formyltetrahydrofolate cyclo-ligase